MACDVHNVVQLTRDSFHPGFTFDFTKEKIRERHAYLTFTLKNLDTYFFIKFILIPYSMIESALIGLSLCIISITDGVSCFIICELDSC